jgi:hypothetical protein
LISLEFPVSQWNFLHINFHLHLLLLSIGTFVTCFGGDLLLVKQDFLLLSIGTLDPSLLPVLEEIYFWLNEIKTAVDQLITYHIK